MKRQATRFIAGGLLAIGVLVGTSLAAGAYVTAPTLSANPNSCPAATGCTTTVTGSGWADGETVTLYFSDPVEVGTVQTSATGTFSTSVKIPPTPAGSFTISAVGSSGDSASTPFTLTATTAATVTPTTAAAAAPLAFTGADISIMVGVAAMAIAVGGILVLSSRRRVRSQDD
ncbi:MAG: IPT/TIG domain-containing protein [Acidimicrobiales bacterium]